MSKRKEKIPYLEVMTEGDVVNLLNVVSSLAVLVPVVSSLDKGNQRSGCEALSPDSCKVVHGPHVGLSQRHSHSWKKLIDVLVRVTHQQKADLDFL